MAQDGETFQTWDERRLATKQRVGNGNGFGMPLTIAAQLAAWPTAQNRDGAHSRSGQIERTGGRRRNLDDYALLAGWPTTAARDWKGATHDRWGENARPLNEVAKLATWATPTRQDGAGARNETSGRKPGSKHHAGQTLNDQVRGLPSNGSPAETGRPGQLNPAFSLYLMGYPSVWLACAPSKMKRSRR